MVVYTCYTTMTWNCTGYLHRESVIELEEEKANEEAKE